MQENEEFVPQNDLERSMLAAQHGADGPEALVAALMEATVFMPVKGTSGTVSFQREPCDEPLMLNDKAGDPVLALFTSPERAKKFVRDFPGFAGGLLTDLKWIMERWGVDYTIALNPGIAVGVDLPRELVRQLGRVLLTAATPAAPDTKGITQ